jgi:hypothetical protein
MKNLSGKIIEIQYQIAQNNRLCTSVESLERFKRYHFETFLKMFPSKTDGYIFTRMNKNGSWSFRWFQFGNEAIQHMNGTPINQIIKSREIDKINLQWCKNH